MYAIGNNGNRITVFCDFRGGYGYTYISSKTTGAINMTALYNVEDRAMISMLKTEEQREVYIQQLAMYREIKLSFQYNSARNYTLPNHSNGGLRPYLFLGFLPNFMIEKDTVNGYFSGQTNHPFSNCDGNENSYFVFYFNYGQAPAGRIGALTSLMKYFYLDSNHKNIKMPSQYYFDFEIHFGGCGGFATTIAFANSDIKGIALGLPWVHSN